jgi:hypothetical protein
MIERHAVASSWPLGHHVRSKEVLVNGVLVKVMRGQDRRQDGHLGLERGLHDTLQDGLGDELVPDRSRHR